MPRRQVQVLHGPCFDKGHRLSMGGWRNGRRDGLRSRWGNPWRFKSSSAQGMLFLLRV